MREPSVRERLGWEATPDEQREIRRLWIAHSKAEDGRDLAGLIGTLTPDCVYEIEATGQRWDGHAGARTFYTSFLGAFPDVHFELPVVRGRRPGPAVSPRPAGRLLVQALAALAEW